MESTYIHMGQLLRPHGILGEIVLDWYAISPFSSAMPFFIQKAYEAPKPITIKNIRQHQERYLIQIVDVKDRNAAELLRGFKLLTLRKYLPTLNPDEAYICDLLGAKVSLKTGELIGHFAYVLKGTARPIWVIKSLDNREILFPAEDQFLVEFKLNENLIIIDPPKGLLELYSE